MNNEIITHRQSEYTESVVFEIKELLHSLELVQILHWMEGDPLLRQEAIHKINEQLKKANIIHEYQKL